MAHRQQEAQYKEQLVDISVLMDKVLPQWTLMGGDWNGDIRTHAFSHRLLKVHRLAVGPTDNTYPRTSMLCLGFRPILRGSG